ncbi:aminotransferase class I/II-fold pyridoxal phosphate-dependent enzyme [Sulfoacidibacillus thermotolerans]|uniref:Orn/Lys/Arg decarboxylases family 1 pyridoxal-P attachment site domain-containing protein n=1 Tax=Sulfoacidibacillus thermotolerans TaxID=1765684 RepID=A0A2U3D8D6_SULT2|nr:aminotransferase class V-fold PLP-dependent enzyme [Sulfoacidibacillus thermotolerans]PWI57531.1 hypothetical protein BM613_07835 [Sulfoacidibacillus thermotolerans]
MRIDQKAMPIVEAVRAHQARERVSLHVPGHKAGQGLSEELAAYVGHVGRLDITELPGADDLHHPTGPILAAQQLAAAAWGAQETYFLVGGSTVGNLAAILTAVGPGDLAIVARNAHQSIWSALELAGAQIVPVFPEVQGGVAGALSLATVEQALSHFPSCKTLIVTSPTYYGAASDLAAIVKLAHQNDVLVIVDEAHGAHFSFHADLPTSAVQVGADLVIHSAHKMLGAFTQSGLLHVCGERVDRSRLKKWLRTLQSSSPSYLLLASIDSARQQMATQGKQMLSNTLAALRSAKMRVIEKRPGLIVEVAPVGFADPFKWVLDAGRLQRTGFEVERLLRERFGVYVELATERHVLFVWTYASTHRDMEMVVEALLAIGEGISSVTSPVDLTTHTQQVVTHPLVLHNLGQRVLHEVEGALQDAIGHVVADAIVPYPPGIPYVLPGETLTAETAQVLLQHHAAQQRIDGLLEQNPPRIRYYLEAAEEQGGEAVS